MKGRQIALTADPALLRRLVARRGITMEGLAEELGMHRTTLYRHVRENRLRPGELVMLCRVLALSDREADALFFTKMSHKCDKLCTER